MLQNGLRLADLPAELAGVLTGVLLLATIARRLGTARGRASRIRGPSSRSEDEESFEMKNSQVAVLCAVILAAASIVAGSNWWLVRPLDGMQRGAGRRTAAAPPTPSRRGRPARAITVAMMPKSKGNAYFIACRQGAEEAARELGVELIWDGPTDPDPARQNEVVDSLDHPRRRRDRRRRREPRGISSVLRKARSRGIKVITWDADAEPDARDFFVNQATPRGSARR